MDDKPNLENILEAQAETLAGIPGGDTIADVASKLYAILAREDELMSLAFDCMHKQAEARFKDLMPDLDTASTLNIKAEEKLFKNMVYLRKVRQLATLLGLEQYADDICRAEIARRWGDKKRSTNDRK